MHCLGISRSVTLTIGFSFIGCSVQVNIYPMAFTHRSLRLHYPTPDPYGNGCGGVYETIGKDLVRLLNGELWSWTTTSLSNGQDKMRESILGGWRMRKCLQRQPIKHRQGNLSNMSDTVKKSPLTCLLVLTRWGWTRAGKWYCNAWVQVDVSVTG